MHTQCITRLPFEQRATCRFEERPHPVNQLHFPEPKHRAAMHIRPHVKTKGILRVLSTCSKRYSSQIEKPCKIWTSTPNFARFPRCKTFRLKTLAPPTGKQNSTWLRIRGMDLLRRTRKRPGASLKTTRATKTHIAKRRGCAPFESEAHPRRIIPKCLFELWQTAHAKLRVQNPSAFAPAQ